MSGYTEKFRWHGSFNERITQLETFDSLIIPANTECIIFSAFVHVTQIPNATNVFELVDGTDSDTIWATADVTTLGTNQFLQVISVTGSPTQTTYPFIIPPQSTNRSMELNIDAASALGRVGYQIDYKFTGSL